MQGGDTSDKFWQQILPTEAEPVKCDARRDSFIRILYDTKETKWKLIKR